MPTYIQDRRGVEMAKYTAFLLVTLGILSIFFVNAAFGMILILFGIITGLQWELATRPPSNNPGCFLRRFRELSPVRPVLVCLGDSLTHGTMSDNWIPKIPPRVAHKMKFDEPEASDFMDPIWIVNAGQNSITSWTVLQERLQSAVACYPDYILIMVGTNDVISMYSPAASADKVRTWNLPESPSMPGFKRNMTAMVEWLSKSSPKTEIGLCTLPPLGEELTSPANKLIKEANEVIHEIGDNAGEKVTVLQVGERMQDEIAKNNNGGRGSMKVDMMVPLATILAPLHLSFGVPLNALSGITKNCILSDCVHLNEQGGEIMADVVCQWLFMKNVHKAIAVKQF